MATTQEAKSAFRHSIRLGTGRAYLLARAHPDVDFSSFIIQAALKNFAYDGQAEPSRAAYLYGLYCLVPQQARIRRAIVQGLASERAHTWTLTQLFALALRLAQQGDELARKAIYHRFLRKVIRGSEWVGAREIIALDGLVGLRFVAQKFGRYLAKHPDDWQYDDLIQVFQKQHPTIDAWAELRQWAGQNADVQRYLQNVKDTLASQAYYQAARPQPAATTDLESLLQRPHSAYLRTKLRRQPPDSQQVQRLAERLLTEKSSVMLENLLYLFSRVKFPLGHAPILALARQPATRRYRIAEFATGALAHLQAPEVRAFALQKLVATTQPAHYTSILRSNYQASDAALLTSVAERFHNEHTIESLTISYTDLYRANPTPACAGPLLALYAKMNCGMHRHEVVVLLLKNGVLPTWLKEELPFDSYQKTQLLHQPPA